MNAYINYYECFNVQIMVRTTGLGQALGRVIRRILGREVSSYADEAPQQRRPTVSAHRKWEDAIVAEDVQHMDHADDEIHEQPEEATVDDVVIDTKGFPGRPHDTLVLMDYVYHVTMKV